MGNAAQTPLFTAAQRSAAEARLRRNVIAARHPALVMWLVGNELNGTSGRVLDTAEGASQPPRSPQL